MAAQRSPATRWAGRLLLMPGMAVYFGPGANAEAHAHRAVQLVWASDGPMSLMLSPSGSKRDSLRVHAALVPANLEHALDAAGRTLVLLLIEPEGRRGMAMQQVASQHLGRDLVGDLADLELPAFDVATQNLADLADRIVQTLARRSLPGQPLSDVVRRAIEAIEQSLDGVPRLAAVAAGAGLSPSRFSHRFAREVGIPFRRFVLWARIRRAVDEVARGGSLTAAAMAAGFSDAAHLTRTFRGTFGLSPSLLFSGTQVTGSLWPQAGQA